MARMSERAVKHVRKALGEKLRSLRKDRGLSQERLGHRAGLSGKFIGEVERGEKSVSVDSLYHVAKALEIPLRDLTDLRQDARPARRTDVERLLHLVSGRKNPEQIRKAYEVLRAMFGPRS
jgi:transcriptional regulator with XRE-family HTH domain